MTIYDVPINELILKVASELEKMQEMTPPSWADFAKTGTHKERAPTQNNWWHIRAAAILQTLQKKGPIGVSKLRTKYGGRKNRGHKPEKFYKASGNILRKILQQLEKAGLAAKAEKGIHKGRIITPAGAKLLGNKAEEIMKEKKIIIPKKSTEELSVEYPAVGKKKKAKKKTAKKRTTTRKRTKKAKKTNKDASEPENKTSQTPEEQKPAEELKPADDV